MNTCSVLFSSPVLSHDDLSKLSDANIINVDKQNEFEYYEIGINKSKLQDLLSKYTSSFTEKIVDNYVDMINEF